MQLLGQHVRPIFDTGDGVVKQVITQVIGEINAAMEDEINADVKK